MFEAVELVASLASPIHVYVWGHRALNRTKLASSRSRTREYQLSIDIVTEEGTPYTPGVLPRNAPAIAILANSQASAPAQMTAGHLFAPAIDKASFAARTAGLICHRRAGRSPGDSQVARIGRRCARFYQDSPGRHFYETRTMAPETGIDQRGYRQHTRRAASADRHQ